MAFGQQHEIIRMALNSSDCDVQLEPNACKVQHAATTAAMHATKATSQGVCSTTAAGSLPCHKNSLRCRPRSEKYSMASSLVDVPSPAAAKENSVHLIHSDAESTRLRVLAGVVDAKCSVVSTGRACRTRAKSFEQLTCPMQEAEADAQERMAKKVWNHFSIMRVILAQGPC